MSKHTPGPWHVATNPGGPEDQPAFPSVRDSSGLWHGQDIICMPLGDSETVKANARLIAAAPEMFDALRDVLRLCQVHNPKTGYYAQVDPYELHKAVFRAFCHAQGIRPEGKAVSE